MNAVIETLSDRSDREIHQRIRIFLEQRNVAILRDLDVEVHDGCVIVKGTVRTFYEKQLATSCCQRVAGVHKVVNKVDVQ